MRTDVAILVGLVVVLAGCLGGGGGGATTTDDAPIGDVAADDTTVDGTTADDGTADDETVDDGSTTAADCGRATGGGGGVTAVDAGETETPLPATTDVERNVTATFVVPGCADPTVTLRVADESEERQRGLMYRQSLSNRSGMVFVYGDAAPRTFWMKNTYVPLDIVFVAPNGTVLNVEHAQGQPHASDSEVDRYSSEGDAKYVVELPRGFANRTGVGPGTQLVFNGTVPEAGPGTPDAGG